jgi:hypothetical protein
MREKYVDEAVGIYTVFGWWGDGTVCISDGQRDVFEGVPEDIAEKVVAAQAEFRQKLYDLLCK